MLVPQSPAQAGGLLRVAVWLRTLGLFLFWGLLAAALSPKYAAGQDLQLLMALDVTGSMKANDPQRLLPKAAHIMVDLLEERDHLGLISFDDETQVRLPLASLTPERRQQGLQELPRLAPQGLQTDLYQALAEALKIFKASGQGRQVLLLLTDGIMDVNPKKGDSQEFVARVYQEIIPAYRKAGIPIYTVAFTPGSDQALLKTLAEQTGGQFLLITAARDLHVAFTRFYEVLKQPQLTPLLEDHFLIDAGVKEAILIVTRATPGRPVGLVNPSGDKLAPRNVVSQVRWFSSPAFDMVTLMEPEPGKWNVSGHKTGDGKVILLTDLKLECPLLPGQVGLDESLIMGAVIMDRGKVVDTPEVMQQTTFTAELQGEGVAPLSLTLGAPPREWKDVWPPGVRVGRFPTFSHTGLWRLQVRVLGKTFNRERNFPLQVSSPWYQHQVTSRDGGCRLEFLPAQGREAVQMAGWLQVQGPTGGVAGSFFQPAPGSSFGVDWPAPMGGPLLINLHLQGMTAKGRPLLLQPPPVRVEPATLIAPGPPQSGASPEQVAPETSSPEEAPVLPKSKLGRLLGSLTRLWPWLLGLLGAGILGLSGVFLYRRLTHRPSPSRVVSRLATSAGQELSEQQRIDLLSRIEELQQENARLQAEVEEKTQQIKKLKKEKESLANERDHHSVDYQEKVRLVRELETRLGEAEKEAKAVQEEYMALYARSQREKQELKKG